jgi:formyl-CoA transferase
LATHADYVTGELRSRNRNQLHAELEQRLQARDSAEWIDIFNKAGVPSGPIYSIDQAFADPQVRDLDIVQKVGDVPYLGQPVTLSRTPSHVVSHPPDLGQHTADVLREFGYDDAEIERLAGQGII